MNVAFCCYFQLLKCDVLCGVGLVGMFDYLQKQNCAFIQGCKLHSSADLGKSVFWYLYLEISG